MKHDIHPRLHETAQVARAAIETKRAASQRKHAVPATLDTQVVAVLGDLPPASGPPTLDALMVAEMTRLEATIGLLQRESEHLMRTITAKREQLSLWQQLQQYRAVTDAEEA